MFRAVLYALLIIVLPLVARAACTGPAGDSGDILYNADYAVLQWCDGTDWIGLPKPATSGPAYCWGDNGSGELGYDTGGSDTNAPATAVGGSHTWVQISSGSDDAANTGETCGIDDAGDAWCWGDNSNTNLGTDVCCSNSTSPVKVVGGHSWKQIDVGHLNVCGIATDGKAYCWGNDDFEQAGENASGDDGSPTVAVNESSVTGSSWIDISSGDGISCGIRDDGTAWCWGGDATNALGCGGTCSESYIPAQVDDSSVSGSAWIDIDVSYDFGCGIRNDNTAWCWGNDSSGQLGNGASGGGSTPSAVAGGHSFKSIVVGGSHACAITTTGAGYCWGAGGNGRLGNGGTGNQTSPVAVTGGYTWAKIEAGQSHSCGMTTSGVAYCWGLGSSGQIGDGNTTATNSSPVQVSGGNTFADITASFGFDGAHSCGIVDESGGGGASTITINNVQGITGSDSSPGTLSNYTVSAGSNSILVVAVSTYDPNDAQITGVTFGGTALTKAVDGKAVDGTTELWSSIWYLLNPNVSTGNIVASFSAQPDSWSVAAYYLTGAAQQAPEATKSQARSVPTYNASVTTLTDNDLVVMAMSGWSDDYTALAGTTLDYTQVTSDFWTGGIGHATTTAAGSYSAGVSSADPGAGIHFSLAAFAPATSSGGCSNPAGDSGDMLYNSDHSIMQWCDGTNWIGLPKTDTNGLLGHWALDDGSGTTAVDSSGGGNDGTLNGDTVWATGHDGGAAAFDGSNDDISMGDIGAMDGLTALTVSAWVKSPGAGTPAGEVHFADKSNCTGGTNDGPFELFANNGLPGFAIYKAGGSPSYYAANAGSTDIRDGNWHFIAGRYDGAELTLWIDGVQDTGATTAAAGVTMSSTAHQFQLGGTCNGSNYWWTGSIDDVRVYDRALSAAEIGGLYAVGGGGSGCSDPAGIAGDILYNTDYSVMQWCDGINWIGFPKPP